MARLLVIRPHDAMSTEPSKIATPPTGRDVGPRLWPSATGLLIVYILVPLFLAPMGDKSHCSIEGTMISILAASVCAYGFFVTARRPRWARIVSGIALALTAAYAVWYVIAYLRYGKGD
jgi:hypothetical protein